MIKCIFLSVLSFCFIVGLHGQTNNTSPLQAGETVIGEHLHVGAGNEVWTTSPALFFNYQGSAEVTHFWNLAGHAGKPLLSIYNTGKAIFNTDVNVGIGTTPQFKLHTLSTDNGWTSKFENNGCAVYLAYGNGTNDGYGAHIRINNNRADRYAFEIFDGTNELLYVRNDGNIGIGTSAVTRKLTIGDATSPYMSFRPNATNNEFVVGSDNLGFIVYDETNDIYRMVINKTGNVGVGTNSPQFKLHTLSTDNGWTSKFENNGCIVYLANGNGANDGYGAHIRINNKRADRYAFEIYDGTNELLFVRNDGNIGIGTGYPKYKLDVVGTIRAQEIKVEIAGADFVFDKNYKLRPLAEVESFINANQHLPEVPSATQMQTEGVGVSEMQTKLLQKVEELTLYMIEQNKRIEKLEKENQELKNQIKK
ncbi:MAG TPA: hypothetical protein VIO15_13945 [Bacteroidales bacterium]